MILFIILKNLLKQEYLWNNLYYHLIYKDQKDIRAEWCFEYFSGQKATLYLKKIYSSKEGSRMKHRSIRISWLKNMEKTI